MVFANFATVLFCKLFKCIFKNPEVINFNIDPLIRQKQFFDDAGAKLKILQDMSSVYSVYGLCG